MEVAIERLQRHVRWFQNGRCDLSEVSDEVSIKYRKKLRIFDLNISRILKNDLKVKPNKILKAYDPTTKQQQ
ncbi:unnamed protein product, partial [Ceratitis capitata]